MSGEVIRIIDKIIKERSGGNATIAITTKTKLIIKGINPEKYSATSEDSPEDIEKIKRVARELNVAV